MWRGMLAGGEAFNDRARKELQGLQAGDVFGVKDV